LGGGAIGIWFYQNNLGITANTPEIAAAEPAPITLTTPAPTATPAPIETPLPIDSPGVHVIPQIQVDFVVDNSTLPWYLALVNRYNFLPTDFTVETAEVGGRLFDTRAADALRQMIASMRAQGLSPVVASGYRTIAFQEGLFANQVNRQLANGLSPEEAFDAARRVVAYPGSSEHNLGLAVDIVALSYQNLTYRQGQTDEGLWLAQNAHYYGFILRYPYHKQHITNIIYEPWHFRYVGLTAALEIFERDLVLEEFIWEIIHSE